jgi:hypothetical protein
MARATVLDESALGLTWTQREPMARSSHALVDGGRVWLIDPIDDPVALARVAALGEPVAVLQLLDRHNRDCAAIAQRLGVPHERVPSVLPGSPFELLQLVNYPFWKEVALWWPATGALVTPEAVGTAEGFAPSSAGAGVHIGLRLLPPRKLARFEPEHLLVGHGSPLHGPDAARALHEALDHSVRDLPRAGLALSKQMIGELRRLRSR